MAWLSEEKQEEEFANYLFKNIFQETGGLIEADWQCSFERLLAPYSSYCNNTIGPSFLGGSPLPENASDPDVSFYAGLARARPVAED